MDYKKRVINLFDSAAELYEQKFMDVEPYHGMLDRCLASVEDSSTVLDVACGPGNLSGYLQTKNSSLSITGIDLAPKMLDIATKLNPSGQFILLDALEINQLKEKYDLIICGFLLPYINASELLLFVKKCKEQLRHGGYLYLSWIEGQSKDSKIMYSSQDYKKESGIYTYYHSQQEVEAMLMKLDFKLLSSEIIDSSIEGEKEMMLLAKIE